MTDLEARLRGLLPRVYWTTDGDAETLDALLAALAERYSELREAADRLYDDMFLATCDPRLVPYFGDDLGVEGLAPARGPGVGDRAWVGSIVGLRRRKGTLAAAARGCRVATGWPALVEDAHGVLARTQSVLHPTLRAGRLADVTAPPDPSIPWTSVARGADVTGFPRPHAVAVSVYRIARFEVTDATAGRPHAPEDLTGRAFSFHPLGIDTRLFSNAAGHPDDGVPGRGAALPLPLSAAALRAALRERRPPVSVSTPEPIAPDRIAVGDLSGWRSPPHRPVLAQCVIDPLLGRLLLLGEPRERVTVRYAYGFAGDLGGGPYGSESDYEPLPEGSRRLGAADGPHSLDDALDALDTDAVILIDDSATRSPRRGVFRLDVPNGSRVRIASSPQAAPVLDGDLEVRIPAGARLELSGLMFGGAIAVEGGGELAIEHCTLAPQRGRPSLVAQADPPGGWIAFAFAISGPIEVRGTAHLGIRDSIVDGHGDRAIVGDEAAVHLDRVTVLGTATARALVRRTTLLAGVDGAPRLESTRWGDPGYCQVAIPARSSRDDGAAHGAQPGAFAWLGQPERIARVPIALRELLPAGVSASITYRT